MQNSLNKNHTGYVTLAKMVVHCYKVIWGNIKIFLKNAQFSCNILHHKILYLHEYKTRFFLIHYLKIEGHIMIPHKVNTFCADIFLETKDCEVVTVYEEYLMFGDM
jgi:hypothetical protein